MKLALICAKITVIFLCFVFVDFLDSIAVLYKYIKLHIHFICFHNLYFNSYLKKSHKFVLRDLVSICKDENFVINSLLYTYERIFIFIISVLIFIKA